jgi:mevalonate pyrophosphate decarboxylase
MLATRWVNNSMQDDWDLDTESITVEQLYEEELLLLREQRERLLAANTAASKRTAKRIQIVIDYFRKRLERHTEDCLLTEGAPPHATLH